MLTKIFVFAVLSATCLTVSFVACAEDDREPTSERTLSADDVRILRRGEISESRYISSGIVGSIVGFGVGHAMEHRYRERRWIFTAGESSAVGLLIAAETSCWGDRDTGPDCTKPKGLVIAGTAGLIGFKIWEIIDLWVVPPQENERYKELTRQRTKRRALGLSDVRFAPIIAAHKSPGLVLAAEF